MTRRRGDSKQRAGDGVGTPPPGSWVLNGRFL